MNGYIYTIRNSVNGKVYVGSTINKIGRWKSHRNHLRAGTHPNPHLQASWKKHGEGAFEYKVIASAPAELIHNVEQSFMDLFSSKGELYNVAKVAGPATMTGRKHTAETILLFKEQRKTTKPEVAAKISAGNTGKVKSQKARHKLSKALRGRKHDQEWVEKVAATKRLSCVLESPTGELVTFESRVAAARHLGCDQCSVCDLVAGRSRTCKGWKFTQNPASVPTAPGHVLQPEAA